jgi:hypothetical protein
MFLINVLIAIIEPSDILRWVELIHLFLAAVGTAVVAIATLALNVLHVAVPIIQEWYPREGAGEWRPEFWAFVDKLTWTMQRLSGAGHLPSQVDLQHIRKYLVSYPVDLSNSTIDWQGAKPYIVTDATFLPIHLHEDFQSPRTPSKEKNSDV